MTREEIIAALQGMDSRTRQRIGVLLAGFLLLVIALSALNSRTSALERKRTAREADLTEMMRLKLRYQEASAGAQRLGNRLLATKADDSPAKVIEEIGIKGKNSQIKPVKGEEIPGYVEDAAEVKMEGLTANEVANLLYRLEKGARPMTIKKALLKQRFDDPAKLDLALTIALIKPAPGSGSAGGAPAATTGPAAAPVAAPVAAPPAAAPPAGGRPPARGAAPPDASRGGGPL